jgi:hypothetical protein
MTQYTCSACYGFAVKLRKARQLASAHTAMRLFAAASWHLRGLQQGCATYKHVCTYSVLIKMQRNSVNLLSYSSYCCYHYCNMTLMWLLIAVPEHYIKFETSKYCT